MSDINDSLEMPPTILSFAKDLANLCSLAGLFSAVCQALHGSSWRSVT